MHEGNTVIDAWNAKSEWSTEQFIKEIEYNLKSLNKERNEKSKNYKR